LLSCCPDFGASETSGIDPIDEAAAAAEDWDDDFLELFASAGAVATARMARVATRIGRICVFLFVSIENLLELNIVHIQQGCTARHMPESVSCKHVYYQSVRWPV
jgi:hypothetical protein